MELLLVCIVRFTICKVNHAFARKIKKVILYFKWLSAIGKWYTTITETILEEMDLWNGRISIVDS